MVKEGTPRDRGPGTDAWEKMCTERDRAPVACRQGPVVRLEHTAGQGTFGLQTGPDLWLWWSAHQDRGAVACRQGQGTWGDLASRQLRMCGALRAHSGTGDLWDPVVETYLHTVERTA